MDIRVSSTRSTTITTSSSSQIVRPRTVNATTAGVSVNNGTIRTAPIQNITVRV